MPLCFTWIFDIGLVVIEMQRKGSKTDTPQKKNTINKLSLNRFKLIGHEPYIDKIYLDAKNP